MISQAEAARRFPAERDLWAMPREVVDNALGESDLSRISGLLHELAKVGSSPGELVHLKFFCGSHSPDSR